MKKKKLKRLIVICFVFVLNVTSFAAIVSDNDGTAFVTKSEFDTLKQSFSQQIFDYNSSIDRKIDGAIAEYLSGISIDPIETKKILYPSDVGTEFIYCMKKDELVDSVYYSWSAPYFEYLADGTQVNGHYSSAWYFDVQYWVAKSTFDPGPAPTGDQRIILTSSDNFRNDFVWDRYAKDVFTTIKCFAYTNSFGMGPWSYAFTSHVYDAVPNLTDGSKYYDDFDTLPQFIRYRVKNDYSASRGSVYDNIFNPSLYSNVVTLSEGTTEIKNVIVWETGTDRWVCMDDPHWVNTNCTNRYVQDKTWFSYLLTHSLNVTVSENYTTKRNWFTPTYHQETTGPMPVFGMYSSQIDMANVKNKNNVITYDGGSTLSDIKLINGLPLLYEKKNVYVEWVPMMRDRSADYNFYLSTTKFTGAPDPSTCIEVSVDGGTPTKNPVAKSGQKLSFTMPSDSVVWLKWSETAGTGGGQLWINKCSEYTAIDRS